MTQISLGKLRDYWKNLDKLDQVITNQKEILNVMNSDKLIFGAYWDKTSNPTMTRTDAASGLVAEVGVDGQLVRNDFDRMPIWGEIEEVTDDYGNFFMRIPKFYIRKLSGPGFYQVQVSKTRYPGFYLPWVFWDFANKKELDYYYHGKYKASLSAANKLESKPDQYPLTNKTIVNFRDYAKANNDVANGVKGYQQLDVHAQDVLTTLFRIEFATLNSQAIMQGFSTGNYSSSHTAAVAEVATNRIIVTNAIADTYRIGQSISVGTTQGGNQIFYGRTIKSIDVYDAANKAIVFDGDPVDIAVGNVVYNTGWKNGFSRNILASSGSLVSNVDGKYPCAYRGIESPFADIWQFVDGLNINERQAWVSKNAEDYASNVFAFPYEKTGYVNASSDGYVKEMGFDHNLPFSELPITVGGSSSTYYEDNYYQSTGQIIARVGGSWYFGSSGGLSSWYLYNASSYASVYIGGRLLKKAL